MTRQELWNGNRERLTNMFRRDPHENLLRWTWRKHGQYAQRYAAAPADPTNAHLTFVRITSDAEADDLVASVVQAHADVR